MITINDIKNNKLVLRDYLGLIKEIVYSIENSIEISNLIINGSNDEEQKQNHQDKIVNHNNKIDKLNSYRPVFIEYINSNFSNIIDDNDLKNIYDTAMSYVDEDIMECYPSIFKPNIYFDLVKNLTNISIELLNKTVINNEVYDYVIDYVNNYNSFDTWKILFTKSVYILCDHITKTRNRNQPIYYSNIEEFNNCVNLQTTPITSFPYRDYDDNYIEYIEVLFSYYNNEIRPNSNVRLLNSDSDDENDDDENDNNDNQNPLENKYTLIENNENYDCGICFTDYKNDYFKCNRCIFKICASCYNNYHLKFNVNTCSMCRL
jgi:hypothetical protein